MIVRDNNDYTDHQVRDDLLVSVSEFEIDEIIFYP